MESVYTSIWLSWKENSNNYKRARVVHLERIQKQFYVTHFAIEIWLWEGNGILLKYWRKKENKPIIYYLTVSMGQDLSWGFCSGFHRLQSRFSPNSLLAGGSSQLPEASHNALLCELPHRSSHNMAAYFGASRRVSFSSLLSQSLYNVTSSWEWLCITFVM